MSFRLAQYGTQPPARSALLKNLPDNVPVTGELEELHAELRLLKQKTLEKAKKVGQDLKAIEESMKRMKEKEKGKAKVVDKIKRERDYTPLLDADEARPGSSSKPRFPSIPGSSAAPSSSSLAEELKKKKKKRKREAEDSDTELDPPRPRKMTPPLAHAHVPKPMKTTSSQSHVKAPLGPDFSVPPPMPLLPSRPPIPPPPVPGPSKPTEVTEDFSKCKQPTQTQVTTFYSSIEPWIRGIKEEDVGFLEYTADEVEPYIMPKLGRHYLEVWEEEDIALYGAPLPGFATGRDLQTLSASSSSDVHFSASVPQPKWDPSTLSERDLTTEDLGHGPLTERLISALLPMPDQTVWKGVKAAEDAMEGRPGGGSGAASRKERVNVGDLEERIRDTMRFHGLLNGIPDYTEKVDDPIATALRHAQRELRTVVATNKARKERLVAIARDRLGYQEYLDGRESIDRNISNTYSKQQKKDIPKSAKKKKKGVDLNGNSNGHGDTPSGPPVPKPNPAALGLGPDDHNRLVVSETLERLVELRRKWVDEIGGAFDQKEAKNPGRIWGIPQKSVYEGIEDDVKLQLEKGMSIGGDERQGHLKRKAQGG